MTMRRILQCVLLLVVFTMANCSSNEEPPTTSTDKTPNISKTNPNSNASAAPSAQSSQPVNDRNINASVDGETVKAAAEKKRLQAAKQPDNTDKPAARETSPAQLNSNSSIQPNDRTSIGSDQTQKGSDQTQKVADQPQKPLIDAQEEPPPIKVMDWLILALKIAGGLLVLALIGMGLLHLRNQSRRHLETYLGKATAAQVSVTREAQKELLDKFSSLATAQKETSSRLHEVHTEIRSLARLMRESSPNRGDGRGYASLASPSYAQNDPSPPKDESEFPVSAVDYLGKMTRFSNVVRPDFQNGILVNDPEGTGELMLIRDSRVPDETQPLFVIPRNTQFQTKQDFYTYYEKYYDCSRPSAGDVWIIDPAVVERVSGGWQLREKGVLEIR